MPADTWPTTTWGARKVPSRGEALPWLNLKLKLGFADPLAKKGL